MGRLPAGVRAGRIRRTLPRGSSARLLPDTGIRVESAPMGRSPAGEGTGRIRRTLPRGSSARLLPDTGIRVESATMGRSPAGEGTGRIRRTLPRGSSARLLPGMSIRVESATTGQSSAGEETPILRPTPPPPPPRGVHSSYRRRSPLVWNPHQRNRHLLGSRPGCLVSGCRATSSMDPGSGPPDVPSEGRGGYDSRVPPARPGGALNRDCTGSGALRGLPRRSSNHIGGT